MNETQQDTIIRAAAAFKEQDRLYKLVRGNEVELRGLCRDYDKNFGLCGCAPHHLRLAVENHGLLDRAV
jgi:hypothetical protein